MNHSDFSNNDSCTRTIELQQGGGDGFDDTTVHDDTINNNPTNITVARTGFGRPSRYQLLHGPKKKLIKVKLLLAEAESDEQKLRRLYIFHPDGFYLTIWALFLGSLVLYLLLVIPFEVAFNSPSSNNSGYDSSIVIFRWTTVAFGLDILVHCNTAFVDADSGQMIIDHLLILKHYLSSKWFVIDLLATFPFDIIVAAALASDQVTLIRLIRTLRLIRLIKLLETKDTHQRILSSFMSPSILGLLSLIVRVGFIAHVFACCWYFIGTASAPPFSLSTWTEEVSLPTISDQYIASFYFIIVTMLTVGYGDIIAANQIERIFAILTMVIGVIVVAFLINNMNSIIASQNQHVKQFKQKIDQFKVDMIKVKVPLEIRIRAQAALEYYLTKRSTVDEQSIFDELSLPIRRSLIEKIHASELQQLRSSLPASASWGLLVELVEVSKSFVGWTGDILYSQGDIIEDIIFIKSGMILASIHTPIKVNPHLTRYMACLSDGELLGDLECLIKQTCLSNYIVHRHSLMIAIPSAKFRQLLLIKEMKEVCERKYQKWQVVANQMMEDNARLFSSSHSSSQSLLQLESHVQQHLVGRIYMNGEIISLGSKSIPLHTNNTSNTRNDSNSINNSKEQQQQQQQQQQRIIRSLAIDNNTGLLIVNERSVASFHRDWIILPFDSWKKIWDGIVAIFILFSLLVVPPQIVFTGNNNDGLLFELISDFMTNFVFFVDFLLNFRLSYFDKDKDAFCSSKKLIARHYLRSGWFIVDGLASLPYGLLLLLYVASSSTTANGHHTTSRLDTFIGLLRLVKLIRVLKVMQLHNYLSNLGDILTTKEWISISPLMFALMEVLLQAFLIAHWLACLWWGITSSISKYPWYTKDDHQVSGRLQDEKAINQYLVSLYFVFSTITTVGYGDIHAIDANERIVAIFLSVIGVIVFSYMIANVTSLISTTFISNNDSFLERIGHVKNYLSYMQCPDKLKVRVINQYHHRLHQLSSMEITRTVACLPHHWRVKILYHVHQSQLNKIPFFRYLNRNQSLLLYLYRHMSPVYLEEGCHLLREEKKDQAEDTNNSKNANSKDGIIYCIVSGGALVYRIHPRHNRNADNHNTSFSRNTTTASPPRSSKRQQRRRYSRNISTNSSRLHSPLSSLPSSSPLPSSSSSIRQRRPSSFQQHQQQQQRLLLSLPVTTPENDNHDEEDEKKQEEEEEKKADDDDEQEEERVSSLPIKMMKFNNPLNSTTSHSSNHHHDFAATAAVGGGGGVEFGVYKMMSSSSSTTDNQQEDKDDEQREENEDNNSDDNSDSDSDSDSNSNLSFDEVMQFRPSATNILNMMMIDSNDNDGINGHHNYNVRQLSDLQQLELALKERNRVNSMMMTNTNHSPPLPLLLPPSSEEETNILPTMIIPQPLRLFLQRAFKSFNFTSTGTTTATTAAHHNHIRSRGSTLTAAEYQPTAAALEEEEGEEAANITHDDDHPYPYSYDQVTVDNCGRILKDYCSRHNRSLAAITADELDLIGLQYIGKVNPPDDIVGYNTSRRLSVIAAYPTVVYTLHTRQIATIRKEAPVAGFELHTALQTASQEQAMRLWQAMLSFASTQNSNHETGTRDAREKKKAAKHILRINEEIEKILNQWTHDRQAILDIENQHYHRNNNNTGQQALLPLPLLQDLPAGRRFLNRSEWQLLPSNPSVAIEMLQALREESMRVWQEVHRMPHDMLQVVDTMLTKEIEELMNDGQTIFRINKQGGEIHLLPVTNNTHANATTTDNQRSSIFDTLRGDDSSGNHNKGKIRMRSKLYEYDEHKAHDDEDEHHDHDMLSSRREAKRIINSTTQRVMHKVIKLHTTTVRQVMAFGDSVFFSGKDKDHLSGGRRSIDGEGNSSHSNNDSRYQGRRRNRKRSKSLDYRATSVLSKRHHNGRFLQLQKRRVSTANDDCLLDWQLRLQLYI